MPNWTSNIVTIQAKPNIIKDMKESLQGEKTVFDFNKIIPMPDSLNITSGSVTHESILIYLTDKLSFRPNKNNPNHNRIYQYIKNTFSKDWPVEVYDRLKKASIPEYKMEDYYNKGKQYIFNIEHYHAPTWYEWSIDNWGTKWNACEASLTEEENDRLIYQFDTAWSAPENIFIALSAKYPDATIFVENEYEDQYGTIYYSTYEKGKLVQESMEQNEDDEYDEDDYE